MESIGQNYIAYSEYVRLCQANNIPDEQEQRDLIRLLHDLGVVLNFQHDPRLRETIVINPEWVTDAVYKIINADLLKQSQGILEIGQLDEILDKARYPREKHWFIILIMHKFELCFDIEGYTEQKFLIPDLLRKKERELDWPADSLNFEYHYDFLPGSVISRFIVRQHRFISRETYWRNGVVLVNNQHRALVKALPKDKQISISVIGKPQGRHKFLTDIQNELADIHRTIPNLKVKAEGPFTEGVGKQDQGILDRFVLTFFNKWLPKQTAELEEAFDTSEPEKIKALKEVLETLSPNVHPQRLYKAAFILGKLYYEDMSDYTSARYALLKAHEGIEALRSMVLQEDIQVELSKTSVKLYQMLVRCYLVEEDENKAFEYAAIAKGRTFVNRLAEARIDLARLAAERPDFASQLALVDEKRQEIDELERQIGEEGANRDELLGKQNVLWREETELWCEMARDYPILTAMLSVPSLSAEQAKLLASQLHATLVEYYRHASGWCAFVVTPDEIGYVPLPLLEGELLPQLVKWRNKLHLRCGRNLFLLRRLDKLYEAAIAPLALESERVIIAPFERLHLLPLSAARHAKGYLVDEHTLSFVPSLTALYVVHQERKRHQSADKRVQRLLSVAYPGPPASRNYLPNVLDEAHAIVERLSKVATIGVLHEEQATPDNVIREAPAYDMIHFGCHGRFKSDKPEESGLRLAGAREDAYLTVQRIIGELNLKPTRLATLAACLTGEVKLQEGEEHVGLLQAMMTAGTQTVVASLWHVDDAATRALFEAFYYREANIHSAPLAMRDASLLLRQTWSHPYYWAAFQVNGLPPFPPGGFALPKKTTPAKWPPDLLEHIEKDKQRSIITRGVTMNNQLIEDNAEVLLKTMQKFPSQILAALRQHPLSDDLAQQSIVADRVEIAKALLLIVMDNPTLRQAFPETDVGKIRLDEEQDKQSRESRLYQRKIIPLQNKMADVGHYLDLWLRQQDQQDHSPATASNQSRLSRFVAGFLSFISRKK